MAEVRQLKLEPMTREAFAPLGEVTETTDRPRGSPSRASGATST